MSCSNTRNFSIHVRAWTLASDKFSTLDEEAADAPGGGKLIAIDDGMVMRVTFSATPLVWVVDADTLFAAGLPATVCKDD